MADGQTYDRANIEKWVGKKGTSPSTKEHVDVSMRQYFSNVALKMTIATFIDNGGGGGGGGGGGQ